MILALDIGASNIRIAFVDKTRVIDKKVVKTPATKEKISELVFSLIKYYIKMKRPSSIKIGVAAMQKNGYLLCTPNMDFNNVNLKGLIEKKFGVRTYVENDAHCAGLAERYFGVGKEYKNFILLTLGTGIGGAIFLDGKLYLGNGVGAEPGHMLVRNKQFERIAAGSAVKRIARKYGLRKLDNSQLVQLARKGNRKALAVFDEIGCNLGLGLINLIYLLDPEAIILGGGFAKVELYKKSMLKTIYDNDLLKRKVPIINAKFGDDAGLIGAGLLGRV